MDVVKGPFVPCQASCIFHRRVNRDWKGGSQVGTTPSRTKDTIFSRCRRKLSRGRCRASTFAKLVHTSKKRKIVSYPKCLTSGVKEKSLITLWVWVYPNGFRSNTTHSKFLFQTRLTFIYLTKISLEIICNKRFLRRSKKAKVQSKVATPKESLSFEKINEQETF